jgi:hypothetical protein
MAEIIKNIGPSHNLDTEFVQTPSEDLDGAFLNESARHLGAALLQILANNYLEAGGYITWAEVTRYYSRYFSILAFTRLVGCATMWVSQYNDSGKKHKQYWVIRTNDRDHSYVIVQKSQLRKAKAILPFKMPEGSGSRKTNWELMALIGRLWDAQELERAGIASPQMFAPPFDLGKSYEEHLQGELEERSRWNYLTEQNGFFFGELDGVSRWRDDNIVFYPHYQNPLSENSPMEDTWEHKMTWSTIVYLFSILVKTPARKQMEYLLAILTKAPANQQMKSQMILELKGLLGQ